jgi:ATP-dependent helicase/nuclease subunit B
MCETISTGSVHLVPFSGDPLAQAARDILRHFRDRLPDLTGCQVLVAQDLCAPQLRSELLKQSEELGFQALLGPRVERLDRWLQRVTPTGRTVLKRPAQELVLAEALRAANPIYVNTDPWLLSDQLLTLFDELTRHEVDVSCDAESFQARLATGYSIAHQSVPLQQEAGLLYTLWRAWREQLATDQALDPATAYRMQLETAGSDTSMLWLVGFVQLAPAEARWLRALLERKRARIIVHGAPAPSINQPTSPVTKMLAQLGVETSLSGNENPDPYSNFIDTVFAAETGVNLADRAKQFAEHYGEDPVGSRLRVLRAADPEQEAQAVAVQIRRWLLEGRQSIALITEDRRIARRVRALLEASEVPLDDAGGWALSTTSAAASVERWLETVEEDFACGPLLDTLKSPFVSFGERDTHLGHVRRFEQDIVLHENVKRSLTRYRQQLDSRARRLPEWSEPMRQSLQALLARLELAADPLIRLLRGKHPVLSFVQGLWNSLAELGTLALLSRDAAGRQLVEAIEELCRAAEHAQIDLEWTEFRHWLGRHLERATFLAPANGGPVKLSTLTQTRACRFSAVIVAGCSSEHLPGTTPSAPFFNQRVRAELGLPTWPETVACKLYDFCRLLHAATDIVLTCHREHDGEPTVASPWLDLLDIFYRSAYGKSLEDTVLLELTRLPNVRPATPDRAPLPKKSERPAPPLDSSLAPDTWSVYAHQRLIDCPYRFFAADALRLKPQDEIRETLSKSDYGSLVHLILQAFNSDVAGLPGPWQGPLSTQHFQPAFDLLTLIGRKVFAAAVRENFQARGWLRLWMKVSSGYLDWEIKRRQEWLPLSIELKAERQIAAELRMKGRIDRIDQHSDALAVVDYKTGRPPRKEDVECAEAVQLPSYALLVDTPVDRLEYLEFTRDGVRLHDCLQGEELQALVSSITDRLVNLSQALRKQAKLPAWGTPEVCAYCEFSGVCRRAMWWQEPSTDA